MLNIISKKRKIRMNNFNNIGLTNGTLAKSMYYLSITYAGMIMHAFCECFKVIMQSIAYFLETQHLNIH